MSLPRSSRTRPSSHAGSGVAISIVAILCCFRTVARSDCYLRIGVLCRGAENARNGSASRPRLKDRPSTCHVAGARPRGGTCRPALRHLRFAPFGLLSANPFEGVNAMEAAAYALSAARLLNVAVLSIWVATLRIARLNIIDILERNSVPRYRLSIPVIIG